MISEYVEAAMEQATYEMIDDEEPFYADIAQLPGVWATGATLEGCRRTLREVLEGWIIVRLRKGLAIPPIDDRTIEPPRELEVRG